MSSRWEPLRCRTVSFRRQPWTQTQVSPGQRPISATSRTEIERGRTVAKTASFFCRDVDEVRAKMKELGLQPGKRRVVL